MQFNGKIIFWWWADARNMWLQEIVAGFIFGTLRLFQNRVSKIRSANRLQCLKALSSSAISHWPTWFQSNFQVLWLLKDSFKYHFICRNFKTRYLRYSTFSRYDFCMMLLNIPRSNPRYAQNLHSTQSWFFLMKTYCA